VDKITAASIADTKPNFTVAVQAAATLTLAPGEIGIFVGTNVKDISNQRAVSALDHIRDHIRESQYPQGPLALTGSFFTPPTKFPTDALNAATFPAFTENEVVIAYDENFYPDGNSTNFGAMIQSLIEVYQERILKFN